MTVGALTHEVALDHDAGPAHVERRARLETILTTLHESGRADELEWRSPEPAGRPTVELVHDASYLDVLEGFDRRGGGRLDQDTRMSVRSLEAALRAAQAAVDATGAVLRGAWESALVLMRPPGHHAAAGRAMGFCLVNHVAVAARWALENGASRVFVLDWDAHHGNGTESIFWAEPRVLYASLHQYPFYPGTGAATDVGEGPGRGFTLNVPLPALSAESVYRRALDEIVFPVARRFDPDVTLVSAGYDAHHLDPLCFMRLVAGSFFRFTRAVQGIGRGPVCVLEGGYDLDGLAWSVAATADALLGRNEPVVPAAEREPIDGDPSAERWVDRAAAVRGAL